MLAVWLVTGNTESLVAAAAIDLACDDEIRRHEPMFGFFRTQRDLVRAVDKQGRTILAAPFPFQPYSNRPGLLQSPPWFYGVWKRLVLQEIAQP